MTQKSSLLITTTLFALLISPLDVRSEDAPASPEQSSNADAPSTASRSNTPASPTVVVHPLFFASRGSGKAVGAIAPLRVTLSGGAANQVRIGFFESEVGGTGAMWRAAGWTAALTASQLLDFDPRTMQVSFDVQGRIDGPSAGALMTVAVIAATRGDTVRADATMTGTINPDGMIGPVGGIVQKIEAAAQFGKKLVLIPVGTQLHLDPNTNQRVDLAVHGRTLGVKVRPVVHIWDAYEALTGTPLPRPESAEPPLPSEIGRQLSAKLIVKWAEEKYTSARTKWNGISDDFKSEYAIELYEDAEAYARQSGSLLKEGQYAASLQDMAIGASRMYMAMEHGRCLQTYDASGMEGMIRRLHKNEWLESEITRVTTAFRFFKPRTLDQLAAYLDACDVLFQGLVFEKYVKLFLANLPKDDPDTEEDEKFNRVLRAAEYKTLAWINLQLAMDVLEQADAYGGRPIPAGVPVVPIAKFYLRAADANLEMLQQTHIKSLAEAANVPQSAVEAALFLLDEDFAALRLTHKVLVPNLEQYFGENESLAWGLLAAATALHARSTLLVAKHYSLGVELDNDGNVVDIERHRAFADWLDMSDDQVRRSIADLASLNVDTTTCVQLYSLAKIASRRDLAEQLTALDLYFRANITAQVLKRVAAEGAVSAVNPAK